MSTLRLDRLQNLRRSSLHITLKSQSIHNRPRPSVSRTLLSLLSRRIHIRSGLIPIRTGHAIIITLRSHRRHLLNTRIHHIPRLLRLLESGSTISSLPSRKISHPHSGQGSRLRHKPLLRRVTRSIHSRLVEISLLLGLINRRNHSQVLGLFTMNRKPSHLSMTLKIHRNLIAPISSSHCKYRGGNRSRSSHHNGTPTTPKADQYDLKNLNYNRNKALTLPEIRPVIIRQYQTCRETIPPDEAPVTTGTANTVPLTKTIGTADIVPEADTRLATASGDTGAQPE